MGAGLRTVLGGADAAALARVRASSSKGAQRVVPAVSRAADRGAVWFALAGGLAVTGQSQRRAALRGLTGWALASALANGPAKAAVQRARPPRVGSQPGTSSFPSGHSAGAAAFATGLALERPRLGTAAGGLAAAVAYARVRTGEHYPGDVLAGVALGVLTSYALAQAWAPRRERIGPAKGIGAAIRGWSAGAMRAQDQHPEHGVRRSGGAA